MAFQWLHVSDFHVGKDNYAQRSLFKSLIDHVARRIRSGRIPDAVFVTGDIADRGRYDEYLAFCEQFLWPLIDILPPATIGQIFLVPGNHDVDRTKVRAVNPYEVVKRVPEFFDPTEQGSHERSLLFPRFQSFVDGDPTVQEQHWLTGNHGTLRRTIELEGRRIAVVGINTAWLSTGDDDRHRLSPGKALIEQALAECATCDLRIVLGHHPLDWLTDSEVGPIKVLLGRYAAL